MTGDPETWWPEAHNARGGDVNADEVTQMLGAAT